LTTPITFAQVLDFISIDPRLILSILSIPDILSRLDPLLLLTKHLITVIVVFDSIGHLTKGLILFQILFIQNRAKLSIIVLFIHHLISTIKYHSDARLMSLIIYPFRQILSNDYP